MTARSPTGDAAPTSRKEPDYVLRVRRIHRRDLNRVWEFLKLCFRDVNRETVEYQRPRSKRRFLEVYEEEGVEQLVFEVQKPGADNIVGYAECAFEISGTDNWMNERYFSKREMRPLFVEELAVDPGYQGRGIGGFILEQLEHLARVRGCTHLVLEVAENNTGALKFYRGRSFYKLDAAIFLAKKVVVEAELLPPRRLKKNRPTKAEDGAPKASRARRKETP
jgi:ribosomal protein S18 acetylase RimI-like enzyme